MKIVNASLLKKGDYFKTSKEEGAPVKKVTKIIRNEGRLYYEMYNYTGMQMCLYSYVYVYETGMFAFNR